MKDYAYLANDGASIFGSALLSVSEGELKIGELSGALVDEERKKRNLSERIAEFYVKSDSCSSKIRSIKIALFFQRLKMFFVCLYIKSRGGII